MRHWLPLVCLLVSALIPAAAQEPFAETFKTTFSISEDVTQVVRLNREDLDDPEDDFYDDENYESTLIINAKVPMGDIDLDALEDEELLDLSFIVEIGDLFLETTLAGGDEGVDDFGPGLLDRARRNVKLEIFADDPLTFDRVNVGEMTVRWNDTEIIFLILIRDASDTFSFQARALADADAEDPDYDDVPLVYLEFADHALDFRTAYVTGTAEEYETEVGPVDDRESFSGLAKIRLSGRIDSTKPPLVSITNPPGTIGTSARNPVTEKPLTLRGLARDDRASGISRVTVQIDNGPLAEATLQGAEGEAQAWFLEGVNFATGRFNKVTITAHDQDGNSSFTDRNIYFVALSPLTVNATGPAAGRVISDLFPPLIHAAGAPTNSNTTQQKEGDTLVLTAVPAADSIFDGWISVPEFRPEETGRADDLRLSFRMQAEQTLTARFILNPFLDKKGSYSGLIESGNPLDRGFFKLRLTANGTFTGTARLRNGRLLLPLHGRLDNTQQFSGVVARGGVQYSVSFSLQVLESGARQLIGTVTGGGVNSAITADLATFHRRLNPATAFAGFFNVLLPPAAGNTDPKYPVGIGFGRVSVSRGGGARFIGKLGDGTVATAGAALSMDGAWPFYVPLYRRSGSLAGRVQFDLSNTQHDLSATLDWFRSAPAAGRPARGAHVDGFSGQSDLVGAKYTRPAAGVRLFLHPNGEGTFSIDAPALTSAAALATDDDATLDTANRLTVSDPAKAVRFHIAPRTGLFTGSFHDSTLQRTLRFSGAVAVNSAVTPAKVNAAGGLFIRGNRTGSVQLTARAIEAVE